MQTKHIFIVTIVLLYSVGRAQYMDTLRKAFNGHKSFDFRYEGRWSFVDNDLITIKGLKVGVIFNKKISLGVGYSWLKTKITDHFYYYDATITRDTLLDKKLSLNYLNLYADYIFYKSQHWQYSIPMQLGVGKTQFTYNYNNTSYSETGHFIALYEPGINVKYKLLKWLGIDANVGYRIVLKNNNFLAKNFNSPVYSAGILISWSEIALMLFPKSTFIQSKLGPSEW